MASLIAFPDTPSGVLPARQKPEFFDDPGLKKSPVENFEDRHAVFAALDPVFTEAHHSALEWGLVENDFSLLLGDIDGGTKVRHILGEISRAAGRHGTADLDYWFVMLFGMSVYMLEGFQAVFKELLERSGLE